MSTSILRSLTLFFLFFNKRYVYLSGYLTMFNLISPASITYYATPIIRCNARPFNALTMLI